MTQKIVLAIPLVLTSCFPSTVEPKDMFFKNLMSLCGQSFAGEVVSSDPQDADFAEAELLMHVDSCENGTVRIPFHVGEDTSRTWVITNTSDGLVLKHDHRHADGTEDAVSQYGGRTLEAGSEYRQAFPADDYSIALFKREGLDASVQNVWALELQPGSRFTYELTRPERHFRAEFNLTEPVER